MKLIKKSAIFILLLHAGCGGGGAGSSSSGAGSAQSQEQVGALGAGDSPAVTWYNTGKPLMDRYCVACHSESGVAPFPLETYQQAYGKRSALAYVLESDTMPPAGYADLTAGESQLFRDWLDAGAPEGDRSQATLPGASGGYTYHADARPVIEKHCVGCHAEGGIAPFPMDSFETVRPVAAAAAFAVENGSMPPWPPTEGFTRLEHPRVLSPEEKHVLLNWLRGDLAEGNPADYMAPQVEVDADAPDFNLTLPMPQAYTPTLRPDDHRCFAIEWPLDEFAYVTDVDVLPDQQAEVHHVIVSVAEPEQADLYYAAGGEDGRPGWYCLGAGGVEGAPLPRQIGGWVPGAGREGSTRGSGIGVRPGSVLVVQMHYNTLVAEPTPDQSTVLVATSSEVERPGVGSLLVDPQWLGPGGMPIPAGQADVRHEMTFPAWALARIFGGRVGIEMNDPWVWHSTQLHMHNLGKSGRVTLIRSDGTEQVMLDIRDWDFNWQGSYRFERELLIQPLDMIHLRCSWDNSQDNQPFVEGEQLRTRYVEWGDDTGDEMCLTSMYMTRPLAGYDYSYSPSLHIESPGYRQQFAAGDLIPLRLILNNFKLRDPGEHGHNDATQHADDGHAGAGDDRNRVFSGHYHVYLDTDDDQAEHLTAWDNNYFYQLPASIEPGQHQLKVSLRGPDHHALGIEQTVIFEVVERTSVDRSSLVDVEDWIEQGAETDTVAAHRPAELDCQPNSWYEEDGALEVETGYCNYLSLTQPSKTAIQRGDTLHLVLWHGNLAFEEPASAHVAVSIGGELVWEKQVKIPTEAEIFDVRVPLDFEAPAGTPVEYHLHNHGYNTWTLLQLELER